MADYYPLIARALDGLSDKTPPMRRAVYDRARTALAAQLRSIQPPLGHAEIEKEEAGLESAISRAEAGYGESDRAPAGSVPRDEGDEGEVAARDEPGMDRSAPPMIRRAKRRMGPMIVAFIVLVCVAPIAVTAWYWRDQPTTPSVRQIPDAATPEAPRPSADDKFSDRIGGSASQSTPSPPSDRPETSPTPQPAPSLANEPPSSATRPLAASEPPATQSAPEIAATPPPSGRLPAVPSAPAAQTAPPVASVTTPAPGTNVPSTPAESTTAPASAPAAQSSSADVGGTSAGPAAPSDLAVAQRAYLIEENQADPQQPKISSGRALWRLDAVNGGQGQPLATIVRATVDIPDAGLSLRLVLRKNMDAALPASHTIELTFTAARPDDQNRVVRDIGLPQLRPQENVRGIALAGLPVPVKENVFLIGLSDLKADVDRNTELLLKRTWIELPIRFASGQRAAILFDKGVSGDRVMADAFRQWGQVQ